MNKFFTDDALLLMRHEIAAAKGNEVFFIGRANVDGVICEVEAVARGTKQAVPAIISRAACGDVVIHNHPTGDLTPSAADMDIASIAEITGLSAANVAMKIHRIKQILARRFREEHHHA